MTRPSSPQATIINLDTWRKRQTGRPKTQLTEDLGRLAAIEQREPVLGTTGSSPVALALCLGARRSAMTPPTTARPACQPQPLPFRPTASLEANLEQLLSELDSELAELNQRLNVVLNLSDVVAMD